MVERARRGRVRDARRWIPLGAGLPLLLFLLSGLPRYGLASPSRAAPGSTTAELFSTSGGAQATEPEEVRFRSGDLTLGGLWFVPEGEGPFPAAVFIRGSGPSTRDNYWTQRFVDLLVEEGVAVLLPDKRGSDASEGDWRTADFEDLADDALAGVDFARARPEVGGGRVGLIGLSQGGKIAPIAASRSDAVAFVIDVVGAATDLKEQVGWEMYHTFREGGVDAAALQQGLALQVAAEGYLEGTVEWEAYEVALRGALAGPGAEVARGFPQTPDAWQWDFFRAVADFDPISYWRQVRQPVLVLYGEADRNAPSIRSAYRLLRAWRDMGHPDATLRVIPGAGHPLWESDPEDPHRPGLHPEVVGTLRDWLARVATRAPRAADWRADVAAFARRVIDAGLAPGLGVAVARDDRVVFAQGFGSADLESGRPVDAETPFYIASSTKSLTALATVLLAERGELDLEAPIGRYLPDLRLRKPLSADAITVEDLLTLTHGIADGGPVVFRTAFSGDFTREGLLALLAEYPPSDAGGSFVYGNLGYNLLGLVLESVAGTSWKEVVANEVLRPLGMNGTTAYVSRLEADRLASPHAPRPDGFERIPLGKADANLHAAGGHFATAPDLARYLAAHQSGGRLEGRMVLPRAAVLSTRRPHVPQDREFGPFRRVAWGYGWDLGLYGADTLVHRFGGFAGYRSHMSFMPRERLGVVVLTNGSGPASPAADLVATYIYDRVRGRTDADSVHAARLAELEGRAADFRARLVAGGEERRARQAPLPHPLSAYAGVYESPVLGRMTWRVADHGLEVRMGVARSAAEVFEASSSRFRVELTGGGEVVEFVIPEGGRPAIAARYRGETFARVGSGVER